MSKYRNKLVTTGIVAGLGLATIPALAFATGISGDVQLNTEVSTSIAMKITSPNDTNPDCMTQSGVTYGVANRYATSNGAEGSKQVDTFDGTVGGADEINTNTSCATLTMTPNTFDSTYSDVTVYTNSPNGYSLSLRSATGSSPNLVNLDDDTVYIPADALTENNNVVPGGQNKWAYKTDANGNIDNWTAVATSDATIRAYDMETNNGSTTRVTYGISAGNNPTGRYGTTLTYTATMFDGANPYVPALAISDGNGGGNSGSGDGVPEGADISGDTVRGNKLTVPYKATRSFTITPKEGYYLASFTCPEGYTCTGYTTGTASDPNATSRGAQTITVTNNSTTSDGAMDFTMGNTYRISFSKSNISSPSTSYVDVPYGGSTTVTVTPASGYYLSAFSGCLSGWTCSGVSTGTSYTGAQTLTLTNNNSVNTGTLTMTGTTSYPVCSSSTSTHAICRNSSTDNTLMVKLKDGHLWTKSSQGSTTWDNTLSGVSCPSGTSKPTAAIFQTLVGAYGGTNYSDYGSPYGTRDGDADLYNATGWSGYFWSTTGYSSNYDYAWRMSVNSSYSNVDSRTNKSGSFQVVCYR